METLKEFLERNELQIGEGCECNLFPGKSFTVLHTALEAYYSTYQIATRSGKRSHFDANWEKLILRFICSHEYFSSFQVCVNNLQGFFELYIVTLLDNVHPVLSRGAPPEYEKAKAGIVPTVEHSKLMSRKTIGFKQVLDRLAYLLSQQEHLPAFLSIEPKYAFFKDHIETLELLTHYRNKTVHQAEGILKDYALDLLMVNRVIPLVNSVLAIEEKMPPLDRKVFCNLNVLGEMAKITLEQDYSDPKRRKQLEDKLNHLCHLKELGRASYRNPLHMGDFGSQEYIRSVESGPNKQLKERAEIEAILKQKYLEGYHKLYVCPCCGTNALATFDRWVLYPEGKTRVQRAVCALCSYGIHAWTGEPRKFRIMSANIFNRVS